MATFFGTACNQVETIPLSELSGIDAIVTDNAGVLELTEGVATVFECSTVVVGDYLGQPPISALDAVEAFAQGFALFVPVAAAIWGGRVILKLLRKG